MTSIAIRPAKTQEDFDAARHLCRVWRDWQLDEFPKYRDEILRVFEARSYARTLDRLPTIHARPKGNILLAELGGQAVGCVMYHEARSGTAEVKRLFVDVGGRGHGLGQALLSEMFNHMRRDGYETVIFSSARFLAHARKLYEKMGFKDMPAPPDLPENLRQVVYFMQRPL